MTRAVRIEIVLFGGFDDLDAIGPYEVFANASAGVAGLEVVLVGAHEPGVVRSSHGARLVVDDVLSSAADLVVVPGGGWNDAAAPAGGVRREYEEERLAGRLADLHAGGAAVASVCTGAILLAQAGVLDGRPATTHRGALDQLSDMGAIVDRDARVVDDRDVLTCGGVTSGLDLALHIVERQWGPDAAATIAAEMEHERRGPVRVAAAG